MGMLMLVVGALFFGAFLLYVKVNTAIWKARTERAYHTRSGVPVGTNPEVDEAIAGSMFEVQAHTAYTRAAASGQLGFVRPDFYTRWGTRLFFGAGAAILADSLIHGTDGGGREFRGAPDQLR